MASKAFEILNAGLDDAIAYARGDRSKGKSYRVRVHDVDVKRLRKRLALSQPEFSARFGFSERNVQNWEQGVRKPTGPARTLLQIIEKEPEAAMRALAPEANAAKTTTGTAKKRRATRVEKHAR